MAAADEDEDDGVAAAVVEEAVGPALLLRSRLGGGVGGTGRGLDGGRAPTGASASVLAASAGAATGMRWNMSGEDDERVETIPLSRSALRT